MFLVLAIAAGWGIAGARFGDDPEPAPDAVRTAPAIALTFPEGMRREDMASRIAAETSLDPGEYLRKTAPGPRGRRLARTDGPTSLEGFLFPATYEIGEQTTVDDLIDEQVAAYERVTGNIDYRFARRKNLTRFDVLIIASMIEREVAVESERRLVASVIYNRLRLGIPLGIDATVQYAVGEWRLLTGADLEIDSPYNTRKVTGLPPGPIASPGEASLRAAARPRQTDLLFYVARNDGTGRHYFSTNDEQFARDVERSRANEAAG